ncbi:membrane protein [Bacteroidia bacterium]|nr:membrane protein [Bacteroidia bacterium]
MKNIVTKYCVIVGLLILFSFFSNIVYSQSVTLTLQETIAIASDSSLQAFGVKNQYLSSYWAFRSFKAARLPSLSLTMTPLQYYRDITRRYDSGTNSDVYRSQQSLYSFGNLSVAQNFDLTGGTFFIDTELGYIRNFGDNVRSQFNSVPIRIGYSQKLFGFNGFKWEKRIEPLKYESARKKFLYERENISVTSTGYFFDLAMAQTEYDMAKDNVASSDTLYRIGEERHKIASISQSDLLTLKLDVVNAQNTFKNAELNLKRAMSAFVSYLNLDKVTRIRLDLPNRPKDMLIPVEEAMQYARENNPDFLSNKQNVLEAEREVERTTKSAVFDANFTASVGFNQVAGSFRDVYLHPEQQDVVSVSLSIPLIDWGVRKGKVNMARNNLNVTKISVQQKEVDLEQDVVMTVNDFNIQQDMIRSAEEAMNLANMGYNATKERFIIGKADINSLTLSLDRQKAAQKNYISALKNYWLSYYKIRKMTLFDFEKNEALSVAFEME